MSNFGGLLKQRERVECGNTNGFIFSPDVYCLRIAKCSIINTYNVVTVSRCAPLPPLPPPVSPVCPVITSLYLLRLYCKKALFGAKRIHCQSHTNSHLLKNLYTIIKLIGYNVMEKVGTLYGCGTSSSIKFTFEKCANWSESWKLAFPFCAVCLFLTHIAFNYAFSTYALSWTCNLRHAESPHCSIFRACGPHGGEDVYMQSSRIPAAYVK